MWHFETEPDFQRKLERSRRLAAAHLWLHASPGAGDEIRQFPLQRLTLIHRHRLTHDAFAGKLGDDRRVRRHSE